MLKFKKYYLYRILSIILLFIYFYPEHYIFLPCSTFILILFLSIFFCGLYFYYNSFAKSFKIIVLYGLIIFVTGFISARVINSEGDLECAKRGLLIISYLFPSIFLTYYLIKSYKVVSIFSLIECIIWVSIIQAIISLIFFFFPTISELYRSFVVTDDSTSKNIEMLSKLRLIGIGDVKYATGAVQYGITMWGVLLLKQCKYGFWGSHKFLSILSVSLFTLVGIMSGRVFFIMLCITPIYLWYLNKNITQTIKELVQVFMPVIILLVIVFFYLLSKYNELIEWAFELFINYSSEGELSSASTDQLSDMYTFPQTIKTWLFGDGKSVGKNGGFYMSSDVGYIRSLFYWGIVGSVIYYYIQFKLYKLFKRISKNIQMSKYVLFLLIWLYIYSFKDFYSIERFLVLFIVAQTMLNRYERRDKIHDSYSFI